MRSLWLARVDRALDLFLDRKRTLEDDDRVLRAVLRLEELCEPPVRRREIAAGALLAEQRNPRFVELAGAGDVAPPGQDLAQQDVGATRVAGGRALQLRRGAQREGRRSPRPA